MTSIARSHTVGLKITSSRSHVFKTSKLLKTSKLTTSRRCKRILVQSTSRPLGSDDISSSWSRLSLIKRELAVAVAEEDFPTAARLRDEAIACEDSLPAQKHILLGLLDKLQNATEARERITSAQALGDLADAAALPFLQQVLTDDEIGDIAEASMWSIFMKPPDPRVADLMAEGMIAMSRQNTFSQAVEIFKKMIDIAPSFAEGYNKLATVYYLMNQHREAVEYCNLTLSMNEFHFGAASGKGMCLAAMGQYQKALEALEMAVAINPRLEHLKHHILQLRALINEKE